MTIYKLENRWAKIGLNGYNRRILYTDITVEFLDGEEFSHKISFTEFQETGMWWWKKRTKIEERTLLSMVRGSGLAWIDFLTGEEYPNYIDLTFMIGHARRLQASERLQKAFKELKYR